MLKVLDPQHKEELHGYLQMVDDEVTPMQQVDDEEEEIGSFGDSNSEGDDKYESDMECEVDEEFRREIKMALGNAVIPSSEVSYM